jgi:hypothetical protein
MSHWHGGGTRSCVNNRVGRYSSVAEAALGVEVEYGCGYGCGCGSRGGWMCGFMNLEWWGGGAST